MSRLGTGSVLHMCRNQADHAVSLRLLQGRAAVLDVGPGSVLQTRLIMDGLQVTYMNLMTAFRTQASCRWTAL